MSLTVRPPYVTRTPPGRPHERAGLPRCGGDVVGCPAEVTARGCVANLGPGCSHLMELHACESSGRNELEGRR